LKPVKSQRAESDGGLSNAVDAAPYFVPMQVYSRMLNICLQKVFFFFVGLINQICKGQILSENLGGKVSRRSSPANPSLIEYIRREATQEDGSTDLIFG